MLNCLLEMSEALIDICVFGFYLEKWFLEMLTYWAAKAGQHVCSDPWVLISPVKPEWVGLVSDCHIMTQLAP